MSSSFCLSRVHCFSPPTCSRRFCRQRNSPSVPGSVPFDFAIVENLHFVSASKTRRRRSESLPSIPGLGPRLRPKTLAVLVPCCRSVCRGLLLGERWGLPCLLEEFCQQAFCVSPGGTCALCESAIGLCAFCRLHCWRGGCVGNLHIDHLHILAEICDLLRQFQDVCLQIPLSGDHSKLLVRVPSQSPLEPPARGLHLRHLCAVQRPSPKKQACHQSHVPRCTSFPIWHVGLTKPLRSAAVRFPPLPSYFSLSTRQLPIQSVEEPRKTRDRALP